MATVEELASRARRALVPPPRRRLSEWIEGNVVLPEGLSAQPGLVRLWAHQREIADVIGDSMMERVTIVKSVRIGFTTLLTGAIAGCVANDPNPILCLLPTEADCRDYVVSDIEPIFAASPAVAGALADDRQEGDRNTLLSRRFPGGSLKIVAARAPRNLRRHNVRTLFADEIDGMDVTLEGAPLLLAERRTLSFPNRKIVCGSTPVFEETSQVLRLYRQSDSRVFEVPCPSCGAFTEIAWGMIEWPEGRPEAAAFRCPHCEDLVEERHKPAMVTAGRWRATRPEVRNHAGFRLNALVSLHANAAWGKLTTEFLGVKDDPTTLQVFVNTILGQGWRGKGDELDEADLAARAEPGWGLDAGVPAEALVLTAGVDVQHDRLEVSFLGWSESGVAYALGHRIVWGEWDAAETWAELDALLARRWPHALGGEIGLDAVAIDAGDGTTMRAVTEFCRPRTRRKVAAIKGAHGFSRPLIERSGSTTKTGARLWIVGADTAKSWIFDRLSRPGAFRFAAELPGTWFEQIVAERRIVHYRRGAPVLAFERIPGKRAESLDCAVYALAARQLVNPSWANRADALRRGVEDARPKPQGVIRSAWMDR